MGGFGQGFASGYASTSKKGKTGTTGGTDPTVQLLQQLLNQWSQQQMSAPMGQLGNNNFMDLGGGSAPIGLRERLLFMDQLGKMQAL